MDWNDGFDLTSNFVYPTPQSSHALLFNYNYNKLDQIFPAIESPAEAMEAEQAMVGGVDHKKRRFSKEQLDAMERSFQEDKVKLDHDRKMKLSMELGLQPKQIAVWFQNRRARWKAKHIEHLYDTLKQDFDTISKEKHNLQQEVMKLKSMLREQAARNQASTSYTYVSGEEVAESTTAGIRGSNNHIFNGENYVNQISAASSAPPFLWGAEAAAKLPSYPYLGFHD